MIRYFYALVLFLTISQLANGQAGFKMPSLQRAQLEEYLPKYSNLSKTEMVKYTRELEYFRKISLEGYNRALIRHAENVDNASKQLEKDRASGKVSKSDYEAYHAGLKGELKKLGKDGEYMDEYYRFFRIYQAEVKFANDRLKQLERESRRSNYRL